MFKRILFITLYFSVFSCSFQDEKDFNVLAAGFVKEYAELFPDETPLSIGNIQLSHMNIPTPKTVDSVRFFYHKFTSEFDAFKTIDVNDLESQSALSKTLKDISKIQNILKNIKIYLSEYQINPVIYNVQYGFQRILNASFDTPQNRLQILFTKLENVPAYYEAAKGQLKQATVKQADETIEKQMQTYHFFDVTLPNFIKIHSIMTPQYEKRLDDAKYAIKDYVAYVESLRLK